MWIVSLLLCFYRLEVISLEHMASQSLDKGAPPFDPKDFHAWRASMIAHLAAEGFLSAVAPIKYDEHST